MRVSNSLPLSNANALALEGFLKETIRKMSSSLMQVSETAKIIKEVTYN
jgi:hypothetical protein